MLLDLAAHSSSERKFFSKKAAGRVDSRFAVNECVLRWPVTSAPAGSDSNSGGAMEREGDVELQTGFSEELGTLARLSGTSSPIVRKMEAMEAD